MTKSAVIRLVCRATAAVLALASPALAAGPMPIADAPVVAPGPPAVLDWSGPYAGLSLGASFDDGRARREDAVGGLIERDVALGLFPGSIDDEDRALLGGGHVGFNTQRGSFVAGVELDIGGLGKKNEFEFSRIDPGTGLPDFEGVNTVSGYSTDFDNLASLRLRAGLSRNRSLFYVTAGIAGGAVENEFTLDLEDPRDQVDFSGSWSDEGTRIGYVVGLGLEHRLMDRLSLRAEASYYDLEDVTIEARDEVVFPGQSLSYEFGNDTIIAEVGISYHF
ncbi:outer membrane protein [Roseitranquillus sediminis]|uniref:outer membrane protein n=1 Tax=Roseitranquillus sediminis TaxID=2809051 RepID=UPI001D0C1500|nr:outer membrane beta-barrel protein [Roseitranquillus sediminis]MBM9594571.1 porin family protein [Roseitranquillus sediminis]